MATHPKTRFTTMDSDEHVGDDYFLSSGDKVRYFFEVDAFDDKGELVTDKTKAINKIGHALHELEPEFRKFSFRQGVKDIMHSLQYKDPRILQSMLIFKASARRRPPPPPAAQLLPQPKIGGTVPPHQDSTFLYTNPPSAVGFWFALEDCTLDNGCMWFLPGSHKTIPVWQRMVRKPTGSGTTFIHLQDPVPDPPESEYVCAPVSVGSLVLIHGAVYHKSGHNYSDKSRWIYTFHCIEGEDAGHTYDERNWLQPTKEMPLAKLYETEA
nr:hypothetical protein HK105_008185 [Polyrhizophydium stewartii]